MIEPDWYKVYKVILELPGEKFEPEFIVCSEEIQSPRVNEEDLAVGFLWQNVPYLAAKNGFQTEPASSTRLLYWKGTFRHAEWAQKDAQLTMKLAQIEKLDPRIEEWINDHSHMPKL